jgi:CubicO group peptidase (beta-lactamase class C family)
MGFLESFGSVNEMVDTKESTILCVMDHKFDELVETLLEQHHIPGMSIAIVYEGKIQCKVRSSCTPDMWSSRVLTTHLQGFGFSQLPSMPATPDTLYFAGSTTKAMTAATAGKIVHSEKPDLKDVQWTTPIAAVLYDEFVLTDEYSTSHVTLEDALSHRSGLPAHDVSYGWNTSSPIECLKSLRYLPFSAELRCSWQYNNMLYAAVGVVIERLTGKKLSEVLEDWLWKPLGMASTTMSLSKAQTANDGAGNARLARGYYWTKDGFYVPDEYPDFTPVAAAGAVISSARDFSLWIKALLEAATVSETAQTSVSSALFQDLTTPRSIVPAMYSSLWEYCTGITTCSLGWLVQNLGSRKLVSHGGGLVGFGTCVYLLPEEGLGFVSMGNTMGSSNVVGTELFFEVLQRLGLHERPQGDCPDLTDSPSLEAESTRDTTSEIFPNSSNDLMPERGSAYTGSYAHPAYGAFEVAAAEPPIISLVKRDTSAGDTTSHDFQALEPTVPHVRPSQRTWPNQYVLQQNAPLGFKMAVYFQRGSDSVPRNDGDHNVQSTRNLACKSVKVLEYLYTAKAAAELDDEGYVKRLGFEVSPELAGSESAKLDARAGMIWFDKRS